MIRVVPAERQAAESSTVASTQDLADCLRMRERAETERSASEARHTPDSTLITPARELDRYLNPPATTPFPLEYMFSAVGDVRGRAVLDLGCGSGLHAQCLARKGARVIAVDVSPELVAVARRRLALGGALHHVSLVVGSAHDIPVADGSVDVVFGNAILHHLDLTRARNEVRRVLKPGGRAVFQEPVRASRLVRALRPMIPWRQADVSPYERPLTEAEVRYLANGFRSWTRRAFGLPHVQIGRAIPALWRHAPALYRVDAALLRRLPRLGTYAAIHVLVFQT